MSNYPTVKNGIMYTPKTYIKPMRTDSNPTYNSTQTTNNPYYIEYPYKIFKPYPKKPEFTSNFVNYNDPYEINSMADVILTTFDPNMKRGDWGGLEDIPILNMITSSLDLNWKITYKPLIEGKGFEQPWEKVEDTSWDSWKDNYFTRVGMQLLSNTRGGVIVMNNLLSMGETMDILANPVKALVLGKDGKYNTGDEGNNSDFLDSMGWGGRGRKNYDSNYGNLGKDLLNEVALDPFNWVTLGAASIKTVVGKTLKETLMEILGEGSEEFSKKLAKQSMNLFMSGKSKTLNNAVRDSLGSDFSKIFTAESLGKKVDINLQALTEYTGKLLKQQEIAQSNVILESVRTGVKVVNDVERTVAKAAFTGNGIYMPYRLLKEGLGWAGEATHNRMYANMKPYTQEFDGGKYIDIRQFKEVIAKIDTEVDVSNAKSLFKNDLISKEYADQIFTVTFNKHMTKILELFKKNLDNPIEFKRAVIDYLKWTDVDDPIVAFKNILEEINTHFDGKYAPYLEQIDRINDIYQEVYNRTKSKLDLDIINKNKEVLNRASIKFQMLDETLKGGDDVLQRVKEIVMRVIKSHPNAKTNVIKRKVLQELRSYIYQDIHLLYKLLDDKEFHILDKYLQGQLPKMAKLEDTIKNISDQLTPIIHKSKTVDTLTIPKQLIDNDTSVAFEAQIKEYVQALEANAKLLSSKTYSIKDLDDLLLKTDKQASFADVFKQWNKVETIKKYTKYSEKKAIVIKDIYKINQDMSKIIFSKGDFDTLNNFLSPGVVDTDAFNFLKQNIFDSLLDLETRLSTNNAINPWIPANTLEGHIQEFKNYIYSKFLNKHGKRDLLKSLGTKNPGELPIGKPISSLAIHLEQFQIMQELKKLIPNTKLLDDLEANLKILKEVRFKIDMPVQNTHRALDGLYYGLKEAKKILINAKVNIPSGALDMLDGLVGDIYKPFNKLKAQALSNVKPTLTGLESFDNAIYDFFSIDVKNMNTDDYIKKWVKLQEQYGEYKKYLVKDFKKFNPKATSEDIVKYLDSHNETKFLRDLIQLTKPYNSEWDNIKFTYKDGIFNKFTGNKEIDNAIQDFFRLQYTSDNVLTFNKELSKFKNIITKAISTDGTYGYLDHVFLKILNGNENLKGINQLFPYSKEWDNKEFKDTVLKLLVENKEAKNPLERAMLDFMEMDLDSISHEIYTQKWYALDKEFNKMFSSIKKGTKYTSEQARLYKIYKDEFKKMNPYVFKEGEFILQYNEVAYQLQLEKTFTNLTFMNNKYLAELVSQINTNIGTGAVIKQLSLSNELELLKEAKDLYAVTELAEVLTTMSQSYTNYSMFINSILMTPELPDAFKSTLISTLQKYSRYSTVKFDKDINQYISNIIENVDTFTYTSKAMSKEMNIKALLDANDGKLRKLVDEFMKDSGMKQHTGAYDTVATYFIMKEHMPELLVNNGKTRVILDIETTDIKWYQGNVYDIGLVVINPDGTMKYVKPFHKKITGRGLDRPTSGALRHIYGNETNLSEHEMMAKLINDYKNGVDTEEQLLANVMAELKGIKGEVELFGFNSNKFDNPFINGKLVDEDKKFFKSLTKHDVYQLLLKKNGYEALTPKQKDYIRATINMFVKNQISSGARTLIDFNPGDMADYLKKISLALKAEDGKLFGDTSVHVDYLNKTYDSLFKDLDNISTLNKELNNIIIDKASILDGTYLKPLQEFIQKEYELPDIDVLYNPAAYSDIRKFISSNMEGMKVLDDLKSYSDVEQNKIITEYLKYLEDKRTKLMNLYSSYINSSSLMYGQFDNIIFRNGYKKMIDHDIILKWFRLDVNDVITKTKGKQLTSLGLYLKGYRNSIRNAKLLEPLEDDITNALGILFSEDITIKLFPESILERYGKPLEFLRQLKYKDTDLLSKWTTLKYYYGQLNRRNIITSDIKDILDPDVLKLLEDDTALKGFSWDPLTSNDSHDELMEAFLNVEPGANLKNALHLKEITEKFRNDLTGGLDELNKALDEGDAFRGRNQAISTSLSKIADTYEEYWKVVWDAKDSDTLRQFVKTMKDYTNDLALQQTFHVLSIDNDSLFRLMVHYAPWIEFNSKEIPLSLLEHLNNRTNDLKVLGINVQRDTITDRIYLTLDKSIKIDTYFDKNLLTRIYTVGGNTVEKPILPDLNFMKPSEYTMFNGLSKLFNDSMEQFAFLSRGRSRGSMGEVVTLEWLRAKYVEIPEAIRKTMPDLEHLTREELFDSFRYNFINLGSIASRRVKQDRIATTFMKTLKTNAEMTSAYALTKTQYISLYFDKAFSINNGSLMNNSVELLKALSNHPEYTLVALVQDDRYGCAVTKLNVRTVEQLDNVRKLNPIIIPSHTFSTMVQVINGDIMKDTALKYWNRLIYAFKFGYMLSPGTWLRNYIDSTVKNMISTGSIFEPIKEQKTAVTALSQYNKSITDIIKIDEAVQFQERLKLKGIENLTEREVLLTQLDAATLYNKYNEIKNDIIRMDIKGRFTQDNLDFYFEKLNPAMSFQAYKMIDGFIKDGPSAGMVSAWNKYYKAHKTNGSEQELNTLWNTFVHYSTWLMSPNEHIEQISRLTEYLILMKRGMSNTEAFHQISKTHFDYSLRSTSEKYAELIFPFYTFGMRNLEYWIEVALEKPWIIRNIDNIMEPVWDFDSYSYEEFGRNESLQYQILSGNIPLTNSGMTLKLSPSFMDAFSMITNPLGAVQNKLARPYKAILGLEQGNSQKERTALDYLYELPVIGAPLERYTSQGPKYYDRTGNPLNLVLPDVFGSTKRWKPFPKKPMTKRVYPKKNKSKAKYRTKYYNQYMFSYYSSGYNPNRYFAPKGFNSSYRSGKPKMYNTSNNRRFASNNVGFYKDHYTKKGMSRLKARMIPVNSHTLKYRIKDFANYK